MAEFEIPWENGVVSVVEELGGNARQVEVFQELGEADREEVDLAVLAGDLERFPVGDHIMLKIPEE